MHSNDNEDLTYVGWFEVCRNMQTWHTSDANFFEKCTFDGNVFHNSSRKECATGGRKSFERVFKSLARSGVYLDLGTPCSCYYEQTLCVPICREGLQCYSRQRPYHVENTGSRLITEVKQRWAWLVLGWVTAWEHQVLLLLFFLFSYIVNYKASSTRLL